METIRFLDLRPQYALIKDMIKEEIDKVLESQQFILGPQVQELEEALADYIGVEFVTGVSSGTDALISAFMVIDIGHKDAIITTPFTFFATVGSIMRMGAFPIFVDIEEDSFNMDPDLLEAALLEKNKFPYHHIKAVVPVHLFGQMAYMEEILKIARKFDLVVIEDAAQSMGADYPLSSGEVKKAGSIGDMGCFSFFPSKNLGGYGDGGLVTTNNRDIDRKLKMVRVHGMEKSYRHEMMGGNFRLDTIQAAILKVKLNFLDKWNRLRCKKAKRYNQLFEESGLIKDGFLSLPKEVHKQNNVDNDDFTFHVYNQYVIRCKERDKLREYLDKNGIQSAIYYPIPVHLQPALTDLGYRIGEFPRAEKASKEVLALPIYPELKENHQIRVVEKINDFYRK